MTHSFLCQEPPLLSSSSRLATIQSRFAIVCTKIPTLLLYTDTDIVNCVNFQVIILILSAFFWLLSLLLSAILWSVVTPLKVGSTLNRTST